jgi:phosphoribosylanthranilate isomerase
VWKALSATAGLAIEGWPDAVLLDTPSVDRGGTGRTFDWSIATAARARAPTIPLILAGGLDPGNVAAAIAAVAPWAVDTASGVESAPGVKDLAKVRAFVAAAS